MRAEPVNPPFGSNLAQIPDSARPEQLASSVSEIENETVEASLNRSSQSGEEDPVSAPIRRAEHDSHIHYTWLTPEKTAIMMVKMIQFFYSFFFIEWIIDILANFFFFSYSFST